MIPFDRERALAELADLARANPRIMEAIVAPDDEIAVRLTREIAERADALLERLADDPRLRQFGPRATRQNVIRLAASIGLDALEEQQDVAAALRAQDPEQLTGALMPYIIRAMGEFEVANDEAAERDARVVAAPGHPEGPWLVIRDVPNAITLDLPLPENAVIGEPEILAGGATPAEAVRRAFHGA